MFTAARQCGAAQLSLLRRLTEHGATTGSSVPSCSFGSFTWSKVEVLGKSKTQAGRGRRGVIGATHDKVVFLEKCRVAPL